MRILRGAVYFLIGAGLLLIGMSHANTSENLRIYCDGVGFNLYLASNHVDWASPIPGRNPIRKGLIREDEFLYILEFDLDEIPHSLSREFQFKINKLSYDYEKHYLRRYRADQRVYLDVVKRKGRCHK